MEYDRQRDWIVQNVEQKPKRSETNLAQRSRRSNTIVWNLGSNIVCKTFFLHTLGYRNDKMVFSALRHIKRDGNIVVGTYGDRRGCHEPPNKLSAEYRDAVVRHIESYRPQISHYKREHAPKRRYLPSELCVSLMYTNFKENAQHEFGHMCSYTYYLQIFQSRNISFTTPTNDLCKICFVHGKSHPEDGHECSTCECSECLVYPSHRLHAAQARSALHDDMQRMTTDEKLLVATVDLQKAITIPKVPTRDHFFSRKLVVFNETFASPGKEGQTTCVLWHEAEAGRSASNICSSFVEFVQKHRDKEEIILYADNCSSQNKNWTLLSALPRVVNSPSVATQSITLKYFEPGHTFMAADSVHGNIGSKMNSQTYIHDFTDIVELISSSRKNIKCVTMDHTSMILFTNQAKKVNVLLKDVKVVKFCRGSLCMFIKTCHHADTYKEVSILKRAEAREIESKMAANQNTVNCLPRMEKPRGVPPIKKKELLQLAVAMPPHKKAFYQNLVVTEGISDLEVEV